MTFFDCFPVGFIGSPDSLCSGEKKVIVQFCSCFRMLLNQGIEIFTIQTKKAQYSTRLDKALS